MNKNSTMNTQQIVRLDTDKANQWHPWPGYTPGVDVVTRQRIRRKLRESIGSEPGKAAFRKMRGLPDPGGSK